MKILLVHNFYQQFGGEDAVTQAEKKLLENNSDEVHIYTRHNNEIKEYGFWDKARFGFQTIFSPRTKQEITEVVRNFAPDVAYIHNIFPLISPSLYHTFHTLGVPTVQVIHNYRFLCTNGWFYTHGKVCERCKGGNYFHAISYRCYRESYFLSALYSTTIGINRIAGILDKITAFVCLTEFVKRKLQEVGVPEKKIFIRPNFIDATTMAPQPGEGSYAVFLGRLSSEKGIWTLIRAFEQLNDIPLKIIGTGPLEKPLREYVQARGLKNICFVGFKQGQEKWELLKNSLFAIVPSEWYENFPVVVLEAYAAAKPVIGSNLGSLPYVIEAGKSGLLFEPGNPTDLAKQVKRLLVQQQEREKMGLYGRILVESKYSPEASYKTLRAIFTQVQRKP